MVTQRRAHKRWIIPRIKQYSCIFICFVVSHNWGQWRIETEDWFEYVDEPVDYAWRHCPRCSLLQHARTTDPR